ncbi:unnamed protein product [Mytilus edulis]|uniref:Uncharacterized protein n=1 Tax=Mytilus edulis TaxID=6550 RepID=A0A8S3QJM3_MYTED|nr:unnamed protein product [Mytilus edulis]
MHLVCLGIVKRILQFLKQGPRECRISQQQLLKEFPRLEPNTASNDLVEMLTEGLQKYRKGIGGVLKGKKKPDFLVAIDEAAKHYRTEGQGKYCLNIFLVPEGNLSRTDIVKHTSDTGEARAIRIPPRRVALVWKDIISQEIDKMLKYDIKEHNRAH